MSWLRRLLETSASPGGGWIYFIADGDLIKIGWSATDPGRRLDQLQTGNARPLRLVAQFRGERRHERALHVRFATEHVRGEWFRYSTPIAAFITTTTRLD